MLNKALLALLVVTLPLLLPWHVGSRSILPFTRKNRSGLRSKTSMCHYWNRVAEPPR